MCIIHKTGSIANSTGENIEYDIRFPEDITEKKPAIFLVHGFKGFKDWGFFPYAAERFAKGSLTIAFNFSLNGMKSGSDMVEHPEKFARNTISLQLKDLGEIITAFKKGRMYDTAFLNRYWNGDIYLMGHSLGGGISIIFAKENDFIGKIAVWASAAKFDRYSKRQKEQWKKDGFIEFTHSRTGQTIRMKKDYLADIEAHAKRYNTPAAASGLKCPILLVHGRQDITVPFRESEKIAEAYGKKAETFFIDRASHVFGAEHPFKEASSSLKKALNKTIEFLGI